ncbi:unnamed protein product, partial [Rotaria sp. Silwood2]
TFKAYYRRYLVKHIIANATIATAADDINVTALDAVHWIDSAWSAVTEASIRNTFRSVGFEKLSMIDGVDVFPVNLGTNGDMSMDNKAIKELHRKRPETAIKRHTTALIVTLFRRNPSARFTGRRSRAVFFHMGGGKFISAYDYVIIDDQIPSFNEWDDSADRILSINGVTNDDVENMEELPGEDPPSLAESLELVRRLRLLSTTQ